MKLFDRVIELTVADTKITGLDIAFEIEKDLEPEPNPCHIEIFNLSPANRATLSKYKRVPVVLKAGYQDNLGIIFKGDMVRCNHVKEEASWKTTLSCGDGANAIQSKRTNKSYAKGTPVKTVVKDLAKDLRLPRSDIDKQLDRLTTTLGRSLSISTNPMTALRYVLESHDFRVSVQNKALQILKKGQALQKEAISLSASSGLLASPEINSKGEMLIRALIIPELIPGRQVHVDSASFKGFLVIQQVRSSGANFGDAWEAEMMCLNVS